MSRQSSRNKKVSSTATNEPVEKKSAAFDKDPDVFQVLESWLSDNSSFSSSTVIKIVMGKIMELNDMDEIFLIPLKEKVLDFEGAKNWVFFIATTFKKYLLTDLKYPKFKFDVEKAFAQIEMVYDLSMEDNLSYIYDDEEEDDGH